MHTDCKNQIKDDVCSLGSFSSCVLPPSAVKHSNEIIQGMWEVSLLLQVLFMVGKRDMIHMLIVVHSYFYVGFFLFCLVAIQVTD